MRWTLIRRSLAVLVAVTLVSLGAGPAFAAEDPAVVRGTLLERGAPVVGGAWVSLRDHSNPIKQTETDSAGRFSFANVPPGRYTLKYELRDRRTQWHTGALYGADATFFNLASGQELMVAETMLPAGSIQFTVVDDLTGAPIEGACGVATFGEFQSIGCANDQGRATVGPLHVGTYEVTVGAEGYVADGIDKVVVTKGGAPLFHFRLTPSATVVLNVRDARTDAPVRGACVQLVEIDAAWLSADDPICSGRDGVITLPELRPRTVRFFVLPTDDTYGAQWVGADGGTGEQEKALKVEAAPGKTVTVPIKLDPPGSISGTVVADTEANTPIADVKVSAATLGPPWSRGWAQYVSTDSNGRYRISGLGPYSWPVHFVDDSGRFAARWSGFARHRFDARLVAVQAGANVRENMRLQAGGTLTGTLLDEDGKPAQGTITVFNARTGDGVGFTMPDNGVFRIGGLTTQNVLVKYTIVRSGDYTHPTKVAVEAGQVTEGLVLRPR